MNIYGLHIRCDYKFSHQLPANGPSQHGLFLKEQPPESITGAITCGSPLYFAHGRKVYIYSDRELNGNSPGQPWCYQVEDVVSFYWIGGGKTIYYKLGPLGCKKLLEFWFIHLTLPLFLTFENIYDFIHAGAVLVKEKPVLFIAPSMGGKSTFTNYFLSQGHTLISDDKVPTFQKDGKCMIGGSHPYHRPYRSWEELGLYCNNFSSGFKEIGGFYVLQKKQQHTNIIIEEVKGAAKFQYLLPNALYTFDFLRKERLYTISKILNSSKMYTITLPWNQNRLHDVYSALIEHCQEIS